MREKTLRLFIAAYPPTGVAEHLVRACAELGPPLPSDARPTPIEQVHLTLLFLGDRRASDLESIEESIRRSCAGLEAFSLVPEALITLPFGRHPRLVAARTNAPPTLLELQRRLATRLAAPERNRKRSGYLPHMTLVRFGRGTEAEVALDGFGAFRVDRITLVRSVLTPKGAQHRGLVDVPLGRDQ